VDDETRHKVFYAILRGVDLELVIDRPD